jgi:hypothetical protein
LACKEKDEESEILYYRIGVRFCLAFIFANTGRQEKALSILEELEKTDKRSEDIWETGYCLIFMGMTYLTLNRFKDAEKCFEASIQSPIQI